MKSTLSIVLVLMICLAVRGDEPQPKNAKSKAIAQALKTFVGTWEIVAVQPPGSTKDAQRLVFRQDQTYAALSANHQELWAGTFDLDPTATPKVWDHRSNASKETGGDALGIYELDGDQLTLCCVVGKWKEQQWTGKPRPTEFQLPEADVVLKLRRVKADP